MPAPWDTLWHDFSETAGKSSQKSPVPYELVSKLRRITALDWVCPTMGEMAIIKPQVDGLAKFENCRYGWGSPDQPRNPAWF